MADILDAAQKQIDAAAQQLGSNPADSPSPSTETSPPPAKAAAAAPPAPEQQPATPPPPPEPPPPLPSAEPASQSPTSNVVETLLKQTPPSTTLPPPTTEAKASTPPPPKVRKTPKGVLLAILLFLFATVPLSVFLVSQQRQLADLRSQATPSSSCTAPDGRKGTCKAARACPTAFNDAESGCGVVFAVPQVCCVPKGTCYEDCLTQGNTPSECRAACPIPTPRLKNDGEPCSRDSECKSGDCGKDRDNTLVCLPKTTPTPKLTPTPAPKRDSIACEVWPGRENWAGCQNAINECPKFTTIDDCEATPCCRVKGVPGPTNTPTPTPKPPTPTPTKKPPTPTQPPVGPQCQNIKIYKNDVVVDPTTLQPGDNVVLAVAGTNATKGRLRVNGAPTEFQETTGTNQQGEFTLPFIVPSGVVQFTIEAEVFRNGTWQ